VPQARRGRPPTGVREAVLEATEEMLGQAGITLSTKEIARRSGVAESSIFYHFGDRLGLLQAVINKHLPLFSDAAVVLERHSGSTDLATDLAALLSGLEQFYLRILPILGALQSDGQLRELLAGRGGAVGPHLALQPVADLLRAERGAGRLRATVDPTAGALLLIGAAHQRALHQYLLGGPTAARFLPPVDAVVATLLPAFAAEPPGFRS
jgi:AcrR family transcriptional regulator